MHLAPPACFLADDIQVLAIFILLMRAFSICLIDAKMTTMKSITILAAFLVLILGNAVAQNDAGISSITELQIRSTHLQEDRIITVSLPSDYASTGNRYPVLYLLDGRTHFQHAIGAVNFLSNQGSVPGMIIVSIHNVDRNRDFSPVHDPGIPTSGGAGKFLDFVSEEVIPLLDENYRTSGFNILLGHSFGGTFAVYSLYTKPELFDGIIAVSPYLMYADNRLVKMADDLLRPYREDHKYFYMTIGDEPDYFEALDAFSSSLERVTKGTIDFKYVKMPSENHATIPYISLFSGLRFIFSDWQFPLDRIGQGLKFIDSHYEKVSSKYGFEIQTPELIINLLGYNYLQQNDMEKAIKVFLENVKRYPASSNVYDSLGEAYENNSQFELAAENYEKACKLGEEQNHVNLPVYRTNLKRSQSMLPPAGTGE